MGRFSHNGQPSDLVAANAASVAAERRQAELEYSRRQLARWAEAERWLAQWDDFTDPADGRPCPFAIEVAVRLQRRLGPGKVRKASVLMGWDARLASMGIERPTFPSQTAAAITREQP